MVVSGVNDAGKYCSMIVVNGIPMILYRDRAGPSDTHRLMCVTAQDPAGNNWGTPEVVEKTWVGHISAAVVNGYPAVAWCSSAALEYAVKY